MLTTWKRELKHAGLECVAKTVSKLAAIEPAQVPLMEAIKLLFYRFPYPASAAQEDGTAALCKWGAAYVIHAQVHALERLARGSKFKAGARAYAAACALAVGDVSDYGQKARMTNDPTKWMRLTTVGGPEVHGCTPPDLSRDLWALLHVRPYVLWGW